MQCTNSEHGSVGYISVGRLAIYPSGQRRKRLRNLRAGPIDHCFFCIIQGFFFSDGVLFCVFHKLKLPFPSRPSLCKIMAQSKNKSQQFVASAFQPEKPSLRAADVEFLYLSQMTGPTLPVWKRKQSVFHHKSARISGQVPRGSWSRITLTQTSTWSPPNPR